MMASGTVPEPKAVVHHAKSSTSPYERNALADTCVHGAQPACKDFGVRDAVKSQLPGFTGVKIHPNG